MSSFSLLHKKQLNEKWKIFYIFAVSAWIYVFSALDYAEICRFSLLFFCLIGVFLDPIVPICINLCVDPLGVSFNSTILSVLFWVMMVIPPFFIYLFDQNGRIKTKYVFFLLIGFLLLLASYLFGINSDFSTFIIQMFVLMVYLIFSEVYRRKTTRMVFISFIFAGLFIAILVFCQLISGSAIKLWGYRLTYNGSVRTLSSPLAIPLFYFFVQLVIPSNQKSQVWKKIFFIVAILALSALLILTYSRGVIISLLVALLYIMIMQLKKINLKFILGISLGILLVSILLNNIEIDEAMFEGLTSGSGRTELWQFFIKKMQEEGIFTCLFGFGPGPLTRMTENTIYEEFYAHSVLFDYLFSYGILGFLFLLGMIIKVFSMVIKSKSSLLVGFFILSMLMYLTHGNAVNLQFHVLLGLCVSMALENNQEKSINNNLPNLYNI